MVISSIRFLSECFVFSIVWLFGVIFLLFAKFTHLLSICILNGRCTSDAVDNTSSRNDNLNQSTKLHALFSSVNYYLWFSLGINSFTCGLMLGTIIYHLIPQVNEVHYSFCLIYICQFCTDLSSTQ